jgi:hypothetical protein
MGRAARAALSFCPSAGHTIDSDFNCRELPMRRKTGLAAIALALLIAVVTIFPLARPAPTPPQAALQPLGEALAFEIDGGWQLAKPPAHPGPFRRHQVPHYLSRGQGGGAGWNNGQAKVSYKFTPRDDADQIAVPLETVDGQLVVALLVYPRSN